MNEDDKLLCHQCTFGCQAEPIILETGLSSNHQNVPDAEEQKGAYSNLKKKSFTQKHNKREPILIFKILLVQCMTPERQEIRLNTDKTNSQKKQKSNKVLKSLPHSQDI
jgi:hypothetical protein